MVIVEQAGQTSQPDTLSERCFGMLLLYTVTTVTNQAQAVCHEATLPIWGYCVGFEVEKNIPVLIIDKLQAPHPHKY